MREREGGSEREGDRHTETEKEREGGWREKKREEGRERWGGRICNDIGKRTSNQRSGTVERQERKKEKAEK